MELLKLSFAMWEQASQGRVAYSIDRTLPHDDAVGAEVIAGQVLVLRLDSKQDAAEVQTIDEQVNPTGKGSSYVVGFTVPGRMAILADRISSSPGFLAVALHELGHDLGLSHSSDPNSMMFPRISQLRQCLRDAPHPTHSDQLALAEVYCTAPEGGLRDQALLPGPELLPW